MTIDIHQTSQTGAAPEPKGVGLWFIIEGALFLALGVLAGALPAFAGLAAALVFAWMLLLSGLVGFVVLAASRGHVHPIWRTVSAVAAIAAGAVVLWAPLAGVLTIALLVAAYLIVNAVASFALALDQRRRSAAGWEWRVLAGLIDLALARFIIFLRPGGDAVLVGYLVAINLIIGGLAVIGVGFTARR
jgi:uncharacterized membrane protein HdeD (DUF308 family)